MNTGRILERIGYRGDTEPGLRTLAALQRAFLLAVPFENLDIHLGRQITLSPEAVFDKLVVRRRGGFCYECNGLFLELLRGLGFEAALASARTVEEGVVGPEFDHMVILVRLEGDYLADAGFGQSCRQPLRLDGDVEYTSEGIDYRLGSFDGHRALLRRPPDGDWQPQYVFSTTRRRLADFAAMCRYHQTSPASTFTAKRLATLATEHGRVTLSGMDLTISEGRQTTTRTLVDEQAYTECLKTHFGIVL